MNRLQTSQSCHQHILSPTSVTNIDVAVHELSLWMDYDLIQFQYHVMVMKMKIFDREDRYGTNCISIQTYSYDM